MARARDILVLQHLRHEHAGSLRGLAEAAGHRLVGVELDEGESLPSDTSRFAAMLVLGGPMHVWEEAAHPWLAAEKAAIAAWVGAGRPYLGICLGHQLLAAAMGGEVGRMAVPELGVCEVLPTAAARGDALLGGLTWPLPALQWHSAAVHRLPADSTVLARNADGVVQAIRVGARAWGLQFHIEAQAETLAGWRNVPAYEAELQEALGEPGIERLHTAMAAALPRIMDAASAIYQRFSGSLP